MKTKESLRYFGKLFKDTYRVGDRDKDQMRKVQKVLHTKAWIGLIIFLLLELFAFTKVSWNAMDPNIPAERLEKKLANEHD